MDTHTNPSNRTILAGFLTGQLSGLIMAVVMMIVFTAFLGHGPLYPVQVIGSLIFGEAALQGIHVGAVIAGLLIHQLGPSLFWGLAFGLLAKRFNIRTTKQCLAIGLGIGVASMVDVYVLVPIAMNALHGVDIWNREVPMFWDWAAHLVFGLSFTLFPKVLTLLKANR